MHDRGCTGSSESTLVKMPHSWKLHARAQYQNGEEAEVVTQREALLIFIELFQIKGTSVLVGHNILMSHF